METGSTPLTVDRKAPSWRSRRLIFRRRSTRCEDSTRASNAWTAEHGRPPIGCVSTSAHRLRAGPLSAVSAAIRSVRLPGTTRQRGAARDTGAMVDEDARDRAIYQALKAVDEVAAALQTHLIEEHQADPERSSAQSTSTNSLKLLRQDRERLGEGLRTIEADTIARSDEISLRRE